METNELIQKLETTAPGAVLEVRPFGKDGQAMSIWVQMRAIAQVARALRDDPAFSFDHVENFCVMELDAALVFTYWARSSVTGLSLIIRGSVELPGGANADKPIQVDSVSAVWPSAMTQEAEAGELFGIGFRGLDLEGSGLVRSGLTGGSTGAAIGFPLRKSFVFPTEIDGQPHMRRLTPAAPAANEVLP